MDAVMSDFPDDDAYEPDDLSEGDDVTPEGGTRAVSRPPTPSPPPPQQPSQQRRRPIPQDDLPTDYPRPALDRRNPQSRVSLPDAAQDYPDETRVMRPQQGKRRRDNTVRPERYVPPNPKRDKANSGLYLPWWSLVLMLALVGCAAVGMLLFVGAMQNNGAAGG